MLAQALKLQTVLLGAILFVIAIFKLFPALNVSGVIQVLSVVCLLIILSGFCTLLLIVLATDVMSDTKKSIQLEEEGPFSLHLGFPFPIAVTVDIVRDIKKAVQSKQLEPLADALFRLPLLTIILLIDWALVCILLTLGRD